MSAIKRLLEKAFGYLFYRDNEPGLLIIGAQKSGTSSLHFYLSQHPELVGSKPKELRYFNGDIYRGKPYSEYKSHFRGPKSKIYFESTPGYLYHPGVAENIRKYLPDVRMIVLLRDPISRAYSAWNHYRQGYEAGKYVRPAGWTPAREGNLIFDKLFNGRESFPTFRECIEIELEIMRTNAGFEPAILRRGLYLDQLKVYWRVFPKEQLMCVGFRDLIERPAETLNRIVSYAGAREISWKKLKHEVRNSRGYSEPIRGEDRLFLEKFYRTPNEDLINAIGVVNW